MQIQFWAKYFLWPLLAKLNPSIHVTCERKRQRLENLIGFLSSGSAKSCFALKREREEHGKFTSVGVPTLLYLFALIVVLQIEPFTFSYFKTFKRTKTRLSKNQLVYFCPALAFHLSGPKVLFCRHYTDTLK